MSHARVLLVCVAAAMSLSLGCASSKKFPKYNVIRLYNDSPEEIYEVSLSAGGSTTELGRLPADHSPTSDRGVSPDPATAQVNWRTHDGRRIEQNVPVAKDVPAGFRGVILMKLQEAGDVDVQFIPYSDLH